MVKEHAAVSLELPMGICLGLHQDPPWHRMLVAILLWRWVDKGALAPPATLSSLTVPVKALGKGMVARAASAPCMLIPMPRTASGAGRRLDACGPRSVPYLALGSSGGSGRSGQ